MGGGARRQQDGRPHDCPPRQQRGGGDAPTKHLVNDCPPRQQRGGGRLRGHGRGDVPSLHLVSDGPQQQGGGGGVPTKFLVDAFSRGSRNHHKGQCMPCRYNATGTACPRGGLCNNCHYHHGPEKSLAVRLLSFLREQDAHGKVASSLSATERARLCENVARATLGSQAHEEARAFAHVSAEAVVEVPSPPSPLPEPPVVSLGHLRSEQLAAMLREATPEHYDD